MAYVSVTNTFSNGSTADASAVNQNFTDIIDGLSNGTKDINMNAATFAGNLTANGNIVLGNATSDTIILTGIVSIATSGSYLANLGGTALLPTYTFTGDLNTGAWSSGADNYTISTAGVQRLNIDANGDGQFGAITAPVNSTAGRKYFTLEALTTAPAVIQMGNATGGAGVALGQFEWYNRDNTGSSTLRTAFMQVGVEGSTANNRGSYFTFGVKADGVSGGGATALKINAASQLEAPLGTTSLPSYTFTGDLNTGMWSSGADALNFSVGGTEKIRITANGVGVGLTPSSRNNTTLQVVNGIGFPATQVASTDVNTLDDYEEGTWTPTLQSATTTTYTAQTGVYTKIGRMVFIHGRIIINSIGDGSTTTIAGLPFTNSSSAYAPVYVGFFTAIATNVIMLAGAIDPGGSTIYFYSSTAAAAALSGNAIFKNSADVMFSAHYMV